MVLEDSQHGCRGCSERAGTYAVAVPGGHSLTHNFDGSTFIADTLCDPRIYPSARFVESVEFFIRKFFRNANSIRACAPESKPLFLGLLRSEAPD